jgi:hypothetical protein
VATHLHYFQGSAFSQAVLVPKEGMKENGQGCGMFDSNPAVHTPRACMYVVNHAGDMAPE